MLINGDVIEAVAFAVTWISCKGGFMERLKTADVLALGFMTFSLFLGAGNIIFPPSVGMAAGENVWRVAFGFLLTGVGMPLLAVIALARVGGGMDRLTAPLGRLAGLLIAIAIYLSIGPLFATPRTAVVAFEMGMAPFSGNGMWPRLGHSLVFFALSLALALSPGKLVDRMGKLITPVLLIALLILGGSTFLTPVGVIGKSLPAYQDAPMLRGFLDGYLTMDTLGALVFGIVIASAVRDQGITEARLITFYTVIAGLIAAFGLSLIYLALFYLGAKSQNLAGEALNGVQILSAYTWQTFGFAGKLLLAVAITLACLTTAVGLITACGEFFSSRFAISYRLVVCLVSLFSLWVSNQGLDELIRISTPVLVGLYPLAIVLVGLCLFDRLWLSPRRVFVPVMMVTLIFGVIDAITAAGFELWIPLFFRHLPLAEQNLGWLLPTALVMLIAAFMDRRLSKEQ